MLEYARLRVRAVEHGHVREPRAFARERLRFLDDPAPLVAVRPALEDADRLAAPGGGPVVLPEPVAVVRDERVGRVEDVAVRAEALLQAHHLLHHGSAL